MKSELTKDAVAYIYFDEGGNIQIKGLETPKKPENKPVVKRSP